MSYDVGQETGRSSDPRDQPINGHKPCKVDKNCATRGTLKSSEADGLPVRSEEQSIQLAVYGTFGWSGRRFCSFDKDRAF